jgi:hypothetical protein
VSMEAGTITVKRFLHNLPKFRHTLAQIGFKCAKDPDNQCIICANGWTLVNDEAGANGPRGPAPTAGDFPTPGLAYTL